MVEKKQKIAVVMFNLGGPDAPEAVRPFLLNFFMDRNIITLPLPFRAVIANLIACKRSKAEAKESYDALGGSSPLLKHSQAQAKALEKALKKEKGASFKTFICMRYWHPMAAQVVREVREWGADKIVFLPLYPQFSTTTTWSSLENWDKHAHEAGYRDVPRSVLCCYPFQDGFIKASAELVAAQVKAAQNAGHGNVRVLFSAHGLPESIIKNGDPYQWQCEQSAAKIAEVTGIEALDWQICYQSRVGPKKWIGPSLDEALEQAALDGKNVVIYPHAFTQEHVETLVELDEEYKHKADELGIAGYYRVGTVSEHPLFIEGLASMVREAAGFEGVQADGGKVICPSHFDRCCMRKLGAEEEKPKSACCGGGCH
jgi:ferrochelatase